MNGCKRRLVLDKSALQGVSANLLEELRRRFEFLVTGTLLHEIATEGMGNRSRSFTKVQGRIDRNFKRVRRFNERFIDVSDGVRWEVEKGRTARNAPGTLYRPLSSNDVSTDTLRESEEWERELLARLCQREVVNGFASLPGLKAVSDARSLCRYIRLHVEGQDAWIRQEAQKTFAELAECYGFSVSPNFAPGPRWMTYGMRMCFEARAIWVAWTHLAGQLPADEKLRNDFLDTYYLGSMAIADGLLSLDKRMLNLAWAAWPGKRGNLWTYDQKTKDLHQYVPDW